MTGSTSRKVPAEPPDPKRTGVRLQTLLLATVPLVALVIGWSIWALMGGQESRLFLPRPDQVATRFIEVVTSGSIYLDALSSVTRVVIGVSLASIVGIPLGVLMGASPLWRQIISPTMEIIRPIPIAAWVPLVIVIFGIGEKPAMALIFLGALFPILLNTISGVSQTSQIHLRAAAMLGATRLQTVRLVNLPSALPSILVGVRTSLGIGWWVVILAELLAVRSGLGYRLVLAQQHLQTDTIVVVMIFIGFIGYFMNWGTERIERRLLRWME